MGTHTKPGSLAISGMLGQLPAWPTEICLIIGKLGIGTFLGLGLNVY
ncbi:hypothetical protein [Paenibacillus sp. yr247]|nr:hypothetical protein [Paenibacillus sp. yr247]